MDASQVLLIQFDEMVALLDDNDVLHQKSTPAQLRDITRTIPSPKLIKKSITSKQTIAKKQQMFKLINDEVHNVCVKLSLVFDKLTDDPATLVAANELRYVMGSLIYMCDDLKYTIAPCCKNPDCVYAYEHAKRISLMHPPKICARLNETGHICASSCKEYIKETRPGY